MKKLFGIAAIMLICVMLLLPAAAALAEGVTTTGAEQIDYTKYTPSYGITDGEGNGTRRFSTGMGCGMGGITLFTGHDYKLNFAYTANDGSEDAPVADLEILDCDPAIRDKYLSIENGSVIVKSSDEPYSFTVALRQNGEVTNMSLGFNVAKYKIDFTDLLLIAIGAYALISAITGSGSFFRNEFVKEGMEDKFKKTVRITCAIVGVAVLAAAAVSIFGCTLDNIAWLKYVLFGIAVAALAVSFYFTGKMTDKEKRAKAQATGRTGGPSNSAAAFEFDENEPTIDDVIAQMEKNKTEDN